MAVGCGGCLPWGVPTSPTTRLRSFASLLPCFSSANLSLCSPSPFRVCDVAGLCSEMSCSGVTWQCLSLACSDGGGLFEVRGVGYEVAVGLDKRLVL